MLFHCNLYRVTLEVTEGVIEALFRHHEEKVPFKVGEEGVIYVCGNRLDGMIKEMQSTGIPDYVIKSIELVSLYCYFVG